MPPLLRTLRWLDGLSPRGRSLLVWGLGLSGAILISAAKLEQHRVLQTGAFDLGIQAGVAWNTGHGRPFYDPIQEMSYLGDHFSPVHAVLALLVLLWPDAASLLVVQSIGIGLALVALCRIGLRRLERLSPAVAITLVFAFNPYLHRVSAFDFHPIAFAIPIFLWLLERLEAGGRGSIVILAVLAATIEETLLPPLVGVGLYIAFVHPERRAIGVGLALGAALLFALELAVAMPFFLGQPRLTHIARYADLGDDLAGILRAVGGNPWILVREWLTPPAKIGALARLLLWFGFLPLLAPAQCLLLLLPVLSLQLGSYEPQWRFDHQYSAIALPFLAFASVHGLSRLRRIWTSARSPARALLAPSWVARLGGLATALALGLEISAFPPYLRPWDREQVEAAHRLIAAIPPQASVCAAQNLLPHLVLRSRISMFRPDGSGRPEVDGADVLLLDSRADEWRAFPFTIEQHRAAVRDVLADPAYALVQERQGLLLLRRQIARPPAGVP